MEPPDPTKDAKNVAKHGFSLYEAEFFDWSRAFVDQDTREDYPEPGGRYEAFGPLKGLGRIYCLVFCRAPKPQFFKPISMRLANSKETAEWRAKNEERQARK